MMTIITIVLKVIQKKAVNKIQTKKKIKLIIPENKESKEELTLTNTFLFPHTGLTL
jgi:hypothetical protein